MQLIDRQTQRTGPSRTATLFTALLTFSFAGAAQAQQSIESEAAATLRKQLEAYPLRLVHESYRDANWELILRNADGSNPVNLTNTPDVDELYPHASPDGTKILFMADQVENGKRRRDVFVMDLDGGNRVRIAEHGRQPFWSFDGKRIGYAKEDAVSVFRDTYVNEGLYFYNVETGGETQHPNRTISGLLTPCMSPDGNWIIASVIRAMGFGESVCALEIDGPKVVELARSCADADDLHQCRPDISPDGKQVAWGKGNTAHKDYFYVEACDIDLAAAEPSVSNKRYLVTVDYPQQTYHVDWSPDGRYIAYCQGDMGTRMAPAGYAIGKKAKGWDLWVVDPTKPNIVVRITNDGLSNKEPDWVPARQGADS